MARLMRFLKRVGTDCSGNVLMMTGLMLLILIAAGGAGIDFGRQQLIRTKLQQASDAGALAAASLASLSPSYDTNDREAIALRYYQLNYPAYFLGQERPDPNINADRISVDADTSVDAGFVTAVGTQNLQATGNSVVQRAATAVTNYDVFLVLDNSGSMANMDVGTTLYRQPSNISQVSNIARNAFFSYYAIPSYENQMCPDILLQYPGAYNNNLQTCITEQSQAQYDCTLATPAASNCSKPGNPNFFGLQGATRLNALRYAANTLTEKLMPTTGSGNQISVISWALEYIYTNLPLTDNKADVTNAIDSMYALESTNSTPALLAAEKGVDAAIAADADNKRVRAVVLMTDGINTLSLTPINRFIKISDTESVNQRSDGNGCTGRPEDGICAQANTMSLEVCTRLKAKGTQVYTIGMSNEVLNNGSAGQQAQAFLRACASPDTPTTKHYFPAATAAELNGIFQEILTQIQSLRITD